MRFVDQLAEGPRKRLGLKTLQTAIALALLFRVATEIRYAHFLLSPDGVGFGVSPGRLGALLNAFFVTSWGPTAAYSMLGVLALCLLRGAGGRLTIAALLLLYTLFQFRSPYLFDGGDNIATLGLAYMLLCLPARASWKPGWRVFFHNLGIGALLIQVMLLYFTSGLMKATGPKWTNGTALYLISQVDWFSLPSVKHIFLNPFISTAAAYSTLLFQLWMPIAYFSPLRRVWVAVGCFFHLGIAIFMGLVSFSLIMIGFELFLLDDRDIEWLSSLGPRARARLAELARRRPGIPARVGIGEQGP